MSVGQTLELIVDDKGALKDVPSLVKNTGDTILDTKEDGDNIIFTIKKA